MALLPLGATLHASGRACACGNATGSSSSMLLAEGSRFRRPTMLWRPAEVNAIEWNSWTLDDKNGKFKYPGWPPTAYISMLVSASARLLLGRGDGWLAWAGERTSLPAFNPCPDPSAGAHPPLLALPQKDQKTHNLILDSVTKLKQRGVKSDWIPVRLH